MFFPAAATHKTRHHVIKHFDLNVIFQWPEILYLYYSRLKPLRPYIQYALHYIQLLSTECGNVLYIVWHSGKACACSAKLWMSHQISIWFQRDTIFSAVDCIFMQGGKWRKSALKPPKYSKVPSRVFWKMFSLIQHVEKCSINVFFSPSVILLPGSPSMVK